MLEKASFQSFDIPKTLSIWRTLMILRRNCEICVKSVTVFAGLLKTSLLGRIAWHGCKMNRKRTKENAHSPIKRLPC